uniref:Uncharacterized protein n=1 Tax=Arundo donax TaxID=35708 RepID=A0A0A9FJ82_ARUDO
MLSASSLLTRKPKTKIVTNEGQKTSHD